MNDKLKRAMKDSHHEPVPKFARTLAQARARRRKKRVIYGFGFALTATAVILFAMPFLGDDNRDPEVGSIAPQVVAKKSAQPSPKELVSDEPLKLDQVSDDSLSDDDGVLVIAEWESPTDFLLGDDLEFDDFDDDLFGSDTEEL